MTTTTPRRRQVLHLRVMLLIAIALAGAAGCASETSEESAPTTVGTGESLPTPVQELDIDAADYTFAIRPDPAAGLRPGWTTIRLHNVGSEAHQVMFAKVKDGVDMADLAAAGAGDSSGAGAIEFVDMLGGASYLGPGGKVTAMVDLPEGTVLAMCYVPTADGVAHALMGMTSILNVTAEATSSSSTTTVGDTERVVGRIELSPEGYRFPQRMPAGWYRVVNTDTSSPGGGLHELSILRLERSIDDTEANQVVSDLANNLQPKVGLEAVGGYGAVSAGFEGYVYLDLDDAEHLAVDFMPDPRDPRPHLLDGYWKRFRP